MTVRQVDGIVVPLLLARIESDPKAAHVRERLDAARRDLDAAVEEMEAFVRHASAAALGGMYATETERRRAAVNAAAAEVERWRDREDLSASIEPGLWDGLDIAQQRAAAAAYIDRVTVARRGTVPADDRVVVAWR